MTTITFSNNLYLKDISGSLFYSTDNVNWSQILSYPVDLTYNGISTGNIFFNTDLNINSSTQWFHFNSGNITVDGQNFKVYMNNVSDYPGMFQNGNVVQEVVAYPNITIKNINITNAQGSTNTLLSFQGWLCRQGFGKSVSNILVENIYCDCDIQPEYLGDSCGGILGNGCGNYGGSIIVKNCSYFGKINGSNSGGIVGSRFASGGTGYIENCHSTGDIISYYSGGICGGLGGENGNLVIKNCSSTGNVIGEFSGGICNDLADISGNGTVQNCYSTGDIIGNCSGGIVGSDCGYMNGKCNVSNCFSTGNVYGKASGGIAGVWFGESTQNLCEINNCYSLGKIYGLNSGGITGGEIGMTGQPNPSSKIFIKNNFSYGSIDFSNNCGSIFGGEAGYSPYEIVSVNVENCYATATPFVSSTLKNNVTFNTDIPNLFSQIINITPQSDNSNGDLIYTTYDGQEGNVIVIGKQYDLSSNIIVTEICEFNGPFKTTCLFGNCDDKNMPTTYTKVGDLVKSQKTGYIEIYLILKDFMIR